MWIEKPNGDAEMTLAGGFIHIGVTYIYNDKPGFRVVVSGHMKKVFPEIYMDVGDAKRDALEYIHKIFDRLHDEVNNLPKKK